MKLFSVLLFCLISILLVVGCYSSSCDEILKNVKVRPFSNKLLDEFVIGKWFVVAQHDTKNITTPIQCLHYQFSKNREPNVLTITRYQRDYNQTEFQWEGQFIFEESNYVKIKTFQPVDDGQLDNGILLDFDLTAPNDEDRYLIIYTCTNDWYNFIAFSQKYSLVQTPAVFWKIDEAVQRVRVERSLLKNFWDKDCGPNDSRGTTTEHEQPTGS